MRNKILYIRTENLNFFYRINRELTRLNIKFEVLNIRDKLPNVPSIILTTVGEIHKFKNSYENLIILSYSYEENFQHYVLKVLAAYKIEYKDFYSDLMFSIDPGTKQIGIAIFLDDLFLISHTIYDKREFIEFIDDKVNCFQENNPFLMKLEFKFGSGVLPLTIELLKEVYDHFGMNKNKKIFLIDESKSSKTKIKDKKKRVRTKHEISALILALRRGKEITQFNYTKIFKQIKLQEQNLNKDSNKNIVELDESLDNLKQLIDKILNNEISLSLSSKILYGNITE
ncbi:MAG: hypothetical protein ACFFA4_03560 [Promethearchaeota archaeon]